MNNKITAAIIISLIIIGGAFAAFSSGDTDDTTSNSEPTPDSASSRTASEDAIVSDGVETFTVDVWADNWFAMYVNGEKVGEDSVPITTERSFNKETFTFTASRPLAVGIEAKDFKETDSGIEYIGQNNQQMGDGGLIAQIKDARGDVVMATDDTWSALVVHRAPLDKSCEKSANPDSDCEFTIVDTPDGWHTSTYDSSAWKTASEYSESAVSPKDGYNEVSWDSGAKLIWGSDLEQDNTILFRATTQ